MWCTGTGTSGIACVIIRVARNARYFNAVDLINELEAEAKLGRRRRIADGLMRVDLPVLDEPGYLPRTASGRIAPRGTHLPGGGRQPWSMLCLARGSHPASIGATLWQAAP